MGVLGKKSEAKRHQGTSPKEHTFEFRSLVTMSTPLSDGKGVAIDSFVLVTFLTDVTKCSPSYPPKNQLKEGRLFLGSLFIDRDSEGLATGA